MQLLLYILSIIITFFVDCSKKFWIWCTILLCFLVNTTEVYADLYGYENYYVMVTEQGAEVGYQGWSVGWYYLCKFFGIFNLSYRGMIVITIIISMYLIHCFVSSFKIKESVFWGLFLLFPALVQCVQVRFFLGTSIVLFSYSSFLKKEEYGLIKYVIGLLIATSIHYACSAFSVLLLIPLYEKTTVYLSLITSMVTSFVLYYFYKYIPVIAQKYLSPIKYRRYFSNSTSATTKSWFIQILIVWFVGTIIIQYISTQMKKEHIKLDERLSTDLNNAIQSRFVWSMFLLVITLPLLKFDRNFHRFLEVGYYLMYVMFAKYFIQTKNIKYLTLVVMSISILLVVAYIYTPLKTVVIPFFGFDGFHKLLR